MKTKFTGIFLALTIALAAMLCGCSELEEILDGIEVRVETTAGEQQDEAVQLRGEEVSGDTEIRETGAVSGDNEAQDEDTAVQVQDTAVQVQDTAVQVQDTAVQVQDTAAQVQDTAAQVQDTAAQVQDTAAQVQDTAAQVQDTAAQVQSTEAISADTAAQSQSAAAVQTEQQTQAAVPAQTTAAAPSVSAEVTAAAKTGVEKNGSYTSPEDVAEYIHTFGTLPGNFITKDEARELGWDNKAGNLWEVAPGKSIGGDYFGNYEGLLPEAKGRKYTECDVNYDGGYRGSERIIFSNDGLIYYTNDHYESFTVMYGE